MKETLGNSENHSLGLSQQEAQELLRKYGRNEIVPSTLTSGFSEFLKFFKDPMGLMLLALGFIYFLMGERQEAIIMLIAFIPVSMTDVFLELRAEKALSSLKSTFQPLAKVFRDGVLQEIPTQQIVPGDYLALEEGQTVPADGEVKSAADLAVSEAALTGESLPIEKSVSMDVYAGTSVLTGRGVLEVKYTGRKTKFGKIVDLMQESVEGKTPLQLKINHLVSQVIKVTFILVCCLFALELARGKTLLQSLLISLTFGMSAVPEEFPLVFTLYLSLGAWRLTRRGVLVKSLPSVETLGSVNVICTDKTGTLTEGKFQLNDILSLREIPLFEQWTFALLACEPVITDTMERAIKEKAPAQLDLGEWSLLHDYPFETEGKHMSHAWKNAQGETLVTMKGALEGVLTHCCDSFEEKQKVLLKAEELASQGQRLLGLAGKFAPVTGERERDEKDLKFVGIMSFSDPIRESAKKAIQICQAEGILVKMITGDHPLTAHAIADQLGLEHSHEALYTGAELKQLSNDQRRDAFRRGAVFSRVTPEQKFEFIQALKEDGMIVAMTGDGVNDAPAMRIADIGISMGDNATDAARATAKMVLTRNDLNGVVQAINEGRRIYSNLRRSFSYLIAFHIPVILLTFFPSLFHLGTLMMPVHIILLEMIVHPVSAFTFENLPSQNGAAPGELLDRKRAFTAALAGIVVSGLALVPFVLMTGASLEEKRTVALVTVLFGNIGFVLMETWPQVTKRIGLTVCTLFCLSVISFAFPSVERFLHLSKISFFWFAYAVFCGLLSSWPSCALRRRWNA